MSISIFLSDNTSYIGKELSAAITQSDNELITQKADSTLGETLLQCDAVVLNLNGNSDEVTSIMTFLKSQELDNEITVIGVSTLLTWASTKKSDRDQIFSERSYKKRKSSVQFKPVKLLESLVLNSQKENLNTYVVAPGILYGKGEHEFHHLFKNGWLCEEPALPILGNGNNRLPTIHVTDLASIILATAQAPPIDQQYIVAVDGGQASQKEIVESISTGLGNGQTVHVEVRIHVRVVESVYR